MTVETNQDTLGTEENKDQEMSLADLGLGEITDEELEEALNDLDLEEDDDQEELDEFKSDHSGGDVVKGSEIEDAKVKNAEDPKADGKKKKGAMSAEKAATKVKMAVEDATPKTKAGMINAMLDGAKGIRRADLAGVFDNVMGALSATESEMEEEADSDGDDVENDDDENGKKKKKKVAKEDFDFGDDVRALFETDDGVELPDEFKEKTVTIFEAAVVSKVNEYLEQINEDHQTELDEAKEEILEKLSDKVDGYLEYVVEEWLKENELAIENGIRSELAEDFIQGLKTLFDDHYIEVPEDKVDVLEELGNRVESLEKDLGDEIDKNIELSKAIENFQREETLSQVTEGLTETQVEKLQSLSEGVDFETVDDYTEKVNMLKETYFPIDEEGNVSEKLDSDDDEELDASVTGDEEITGPMAGYMKAISKQIVK